jgi:hypothetical protein
MYICEMNVKTLCFDKDVFSYGHYLRFVRIQLSFMALYENILGYGGEKPTSWKCWAKKLLESLHCHCFLHPFFSSPLLTFQLTSDFLENTLSESFVLVREKDRKRKKCFLYFVMYISIIYPFCYMLVIYLFMFLFFSYGDQWYHSP